MEQTTAFLLTDDSNRARLLVDTLASYGVRALEVPLSGGGVLLSGGQDGAWLAYGDEVEHLPLSVFRTRISESPLRDLPGFAILSKRHLQKQPAWLSLFDKVSLSDFDPETLAFRIHWCRGRKSGSSDMGRRVVRLVNHDINNPLTAIRILSEMLVGDVTDTMAQADLRDIMEAADVAAGNIEGLSLMLRAGEDLNVATWVSTSLEGVVKDALNRPALKNCVEFLGSTGGCMVEGDQGLIRGALTDVLMNARKMTDGRTRVEVSLRGDAKTVQFVCRAVEIGIPTEHWDHLLAENGSVYLREKRFPVTPTGLFAAQVIMVLHGGRLQMDLSDDGGLQVSCIFPAARHGQRR